MHEEFCAKRKQNFEEFGREQEKLYQQQLRNLAQVLMTEYFQAPSVGVIPPAPVESPRWVEEDQPQVITGDCVMITPKPAKQDLWQKLTPTVRVRWGFGRRNLHTVVWLLLASGSLYIFKPWLALAFCGLALCSLRRRIQVAWTFITPKQRWGRWKR